MRSNRRITVLTYDGHCPTVNSVNTKAIRWSRRWPDSNGPYEVEIELGIVRDDTGERLDATSIRLSSTTKAITTSTLRRVQVWTLVREAIASEVAPLVGILRRPAFPGQTVVTDVEDGKLVHRVVNEDLVRESRERHWDAQAERLRIDEAAQRPTGARRTITTELLREVARVHKEARANGNDQPRRAVASHFKVSEDTASRWITKARDADLLEPSGRARKSKTSTTNPKRGKDHG